MKTREDRFWFLVERKGPEDCWPWQGKLNSNGYGQHARAYALTKGAVPEGMVVMHGCNNRACCNPAHLTLGTQKENLAFARLCGRLDNRRKAVAVRAAKQGTGVQYDKRAKRYYVMFKALGKPLYVGSYADKALAVAIATAALDVKDKYLLTTQYPSYEELKAKFHESH